jgi:hypothetical protein
MNKYGLVYFILLLFTDCPYSTNPLVIPPHLTSVAIPTFANVTNQPELDIQITDAIRQEFLLDNSLAIRDENIATSLLTGQVKSYVKTPNAFDESERVKEYKLTITLSITYIDKVENKERLKEKSVSQYRIYSIIDESGNRLDETTLETENRTKLVKQVAEEVLNSIFGDW